MQKLPPRRLSYGLLALLALVGVILNPVILRTIDVLGTPLFFAMSLLTELLLIFATVYLLIRALWPLWARFTNRLRKRWQAFVAKHHLATPRKSDSPELSAVKALIRREHDFGLVLITIAAASIASLIAFIDLARDVIFRDSLTQIDTRIANLIPTIRTPAQTHFFSFITFLANPQTVVVAVALTVLVLWSARQRLAAAVMVTAAGVEAAVMLVLKDAIGRLRPDASLRLVHESSYSFPSGHVLTALVVYGVLTYFIVREIRSELLRVIHLLVYVAVVFLVAASRVYLDVHYASDVLASVFLGCFLLGTLIVAYELTGFIRNHRHPFTVPPVHSRGLYAIPVVVAVWAAVLYPAFIKPVAAAPKVTPTQILTALDAAHLHRLPLYSETVTGRQQEPISSIYVGTRAALVNTFESHGWYRADPSTIRNTFKAIAIGFQNQQYLNAPVTPVYLDARPEDLAFEQPTDSHSLRQRHHTRLWLTSFVTTNGEPIWVGTASYDEGIELSKYTHLPTHHIDPNLDAERAFILSSIGQAEAPLVPITPAFSGTNGNGDTYFTDGYAAVVRLPVSKP